MGTGIHAPFEGCTGGVPHNSSFALVYVHLYATFPALMCRLKCVQEKHCVPPPMDMLERATCQALIGQPRMWLVAPTLVSPGSYSVEGTNGDLDARRWSMHQRENAARPLGFISTISYGCAHTHINMDACIGVVPT